MGDHFVLLVDHLLTESTLEAAIESRNRMQSTQLVIGDKKVDRSLNKMNVANTASQGKLVECRICQDEDEDSNMEAPCCCCGSMKYAHRQCVQRWCNEKGDTICEICHQQFKPGYIAPPPLFQFGRIPMNFRGNWEIARTDANGPRIIAMVSTNRNFLNPHYNDISVSATRSFMCCRSVAVILMILLILRHTLPLLTSRTNEYSFPLILLLLLRTAGITLPIFVVVRAITAILRRRQQQEAYNSSLTSSDEETEDLTLQPQSQSPTHVIQLH